MSEVLNWLHARVAPEADWRSDSREVRAGDVFLAFPGEAHDGRDHVAAAVAAGAAAILYEAEQADPAAIRQDVGEVVATLAVPQLARQAAQLAALWYGEPSRALSVVAITGTNGKTTTTQWLAQALRHLRVPCGVIGTLGATLPDGSHEALTLTTPDGVTLQRLLHRMRLAGAQVVALEASSIGLAQGRLDSVAIAVAGFTNLSRDHLDYHGDMAQYAAAKLRLFAWKGLRSAVINGDDPLAPSLRGQLGQVPCLVYRRQSGSAAVVGASALPSAVLCADKVSFVAGGMRARFLTPDGQALSLTAPILGEHNVENLLLVAGLLRQLGHEWAAIGSALSALASVPGRLQVVPGPDDSAGPLVCVDYAHTPDALAHVLRTLRSVSAQRQGRLIVVFGCGGNRDAGKRPLMGETAGRLADEVWVTSDNPRYEKPAAIIEQIMAGASGGPVVWHREPDREVAILRAITSAAPSDVVLLAGKGHENTQEIAGSRLAFDDVQWARLALWWPTCRGVTIDSRQVRPGQLFVAVQGERFDGNAFIADALAAGAAIAVGAGGGGGGGAPWGGGGAPVPPRAALP